MPISAKYYDGKSSKSHNVMISFYQDKSIEIIGDEVEIKTSLDKIKISSRIGNTPRIIYLEEGDKCESLENDEIDMILKKLLNKNSLLYKLENSKSAVLGSFAALIATIYLIFAYGVPVVSNIISIFVPKSFEISLGKDALKFLDENYYLRKTTLPQRRQDEIKDIFKIVTNNNKEYKLHFREGGFIGANALSLPSKDIIITDELIKMINDDAIFGILAHEMGHNEYRHSIKNLIATSINSFAIALIIGDVSSILATIPTALINRGYSRDFEREADDYAIIKLKQHKISPKGMIEFFEKISEKYDEDENLTFLSTHPLSKERIERFKKEF